MKKDENYTEHTPLSASRIKTLHECSWKYWCKYILKTPDSENEGSLRGSICHVIFDCLGKERHHKHFLKIIKEKTIWKCKPVARLVLSFCEKKGIDDDENLSLIDRMILEGLNYDFFAKVAAGRSKLTEAHSELNFDICVDEDDRSFRILGFIDKLFLFKGKKLALIRDFKTSKSVFSSGELEDNIQDLMYRLAAKRLYPEYINQQMEFVFVKFPCDHNLEGVVKTSEVSNDELLGFEYQLSEIQEEIDNFTEESAYDNFAADQDYPDKDEGFCGKLLCGYAKYPGHIKPSTGKPYWHCPVKFPFDYYKVEDPNGNLIKGLHLDDKDGIDKARRLGCKLKKVAYNGCPRYNSVINPNKVLL